MYRSANRKQYKYRFLITGMENLRDPMRSFLDAQKARMEAYENGEYELSDGEGFECMECGWTGLTAPMADENERDLETEQIVKCPECGSMDIATSGTDLKYFQNFGYEYEELPRDIPNGEAEDYRLD